MSPDLSLANTFGLASPEPEPIDLSTPEGIELAVYGPFGKFRGIIRRPDGSNLFLPKPKKVES